MSTSSLSSCTDRQRAIPSPASAVSASPPSVRSVRPSRQLITVRPSAEISGPRFLMTLSLAVNDSYRHDPVLLHTLHSNLCSSYCRSSSLSCRCFVLAASIIQHTSADIILRPDERARGGGWTIEGRRHQSPAHSTSIDEYFSQRDGSRYKRRGFLPINRCHGASQTSAPIRLLTFSPSLIRLVLWSVDLRCDCV